MDTDKSSIEFQQQSQNMTTEQVVEEPKAVEDQFYSKAVNYWKDVSATYDGMLGGYAHISHTDISGSRLFLTQLFKSFNPNTERALDCGAGIGRVSKHLLTCYFKQVDMVEQNPVFLEKAQINMQLKADKVGKYYATGLQNFVPENKYDVIWCQWVLGHLTDDDLIAFFNTCRNCLAENGVIVIKENVTSSGEVEMDETDSSVTRPFRYYVDLFEKCKMVCLRKLKQPHFPKELYSVYMFALKPKPITQTDI